MVLATGTATQHLPAGEAMATLYVGLRSAKIEGTVAEVLGYKDSYQHRTVSTSIGYLTPSCAVDRMARD